MNGIGVMNPRFQGRNEGPFKEVLLFYENSGSIRGERNPFQRVMKRSLRTAAIVVAELSLTQDMRLPPARHGLAYFAGVSATYRSREC